MKEDFEERPNIYSKKKTQVQKNWKLQWSADGPAYQFSGSTQDEVELRTVPVWVEMAGLEDGVVKGPLKNK